MSQPELQTTQSNTKSVQVQYRWASVTPPQEGFPHTSLHSPALVSGSHSPPPSSQRDVFIHWVHVRAFLLALDSTHMPEPVAGRHLLGFLSSSSSWMPAAVEDRDMLQLQQRAHLFWTVFFVAPSPPPPPGCNKWKRWRDTKRRHRLVCSSQSPWSSVGSRASCGIDATDAGLPGTKSLCSSDDPYKHGVVSPVAHRNCNQSLFPLIENTYRLFVEFMLSGVISSSASSSAVRTLSVFPLQTDSLRRRRLTWTGFITTLMVITVTLFSVFYGLKPTRYIWFIVSVHFIFRVVDRVYSDTYEPKQQRQQQ